MASSQRSSPPPPLRVSSASHSRSHSRAASPGPLSARARPSDVGSSRLSLSHPAEDDRGVGPSTITLTRGRSISGGRASIADSFATAEEGDNDDDLDDKGSDLDLDELEAELRESGSDSESPGKSASLSSFSDAFDFEFDEYDEEEEVSGEEIDPAQPLVRGGRRRRKWEQEPGDGDKGLFELIPPLILAHPLALFPALAAVPYDFLPAGVALFVPVFCVLAALSLCAHIVIVYLAWYLKVWSFEEVFAKCVGERFGKYGLGIGRAFVLVSVIGTTIGWLESESALFPLIRPIAATYLPEGVLQSRILWTIVASMALLPAIAPSRALRSLRIMPIILVTLLPVVTFIAIGRTSEIHDANEEAGGHANSTSFVGDAAKHMTHAVTHAVTHAASETVSSATLLRRGLRGLSAGNAGSGLTTIAVFFTPHLLTLPIHGTLARAKRQKFIVPVLATTVILVVLALPLALVPYYLLPAAPTVFQQLPDDDGWVNFARALMCAIVLGSVNLWLLRGRDTVLSALEVDRAERYKAGRWVGLGLWVLVVVFACIGGVVADKIQISGVMATLAVGWLLPSVFFIITFHVRSPLAIIFPNRAAAQAAAAAAAATPAASENPSPARGAPRAGHTRTDSLQDPASDVLLARKERQLQKRRLGRRLWQDMVVYVGILPVGCVTIAWSVGSFLGIW
ncbi:uncharacterized protein LOC62_04G005960 [Vanrija pseudolonga]|uniref:Amino acid transporter transmembrane domain-containing protein n=1 Tax=Vanrija pseudolonga TaxID=143232 RepID=A0AAF0YAK7_9TREE|nr:hypothetical protein LOC62_04G005960 [Vanrija pseudolonga]